MATTTSAPGDALAQARARMFATLHAEHTEAGDVEDYGPDPDDLYDLITER